MSDQKDLYLELVKKGLDTKESARLAGYKEGYVPEERPSKRISKALRKKGVTDDKIAETVAEGLEAQNRFGTADHNARTKYLALLSKWLGYEKDAINVIIGLNSTGQIVDAEKVNEAIRVLEAELVGRDEPASVSSTGPSLTQEPVSQPEPSPASNEAPKGS